MALLYLSRRKGEKIELFNQLQCTILSIDKDLVHLEFALIRPDNQTNKRKLTLTLVEEGVKCTLL